MRRSIAALAVLGVCLAGTVMTAGPARASYPGENGRLAFGVIRPDGNQDIYSVEPNGDDFGRLTTSTRVDICPAYSPNGKSIAYCAGPITGGSATIEIWVMKANGQHQTQLTQTNGRLTFPDFSPDGSRIAFSGRMPGDATTTDIFLMNADGTGITRLTTDLGNDRYPAWSPDGSKIAFESDRTGVFQVWVMDADGTNPRQVTTDPAAKDQLPDWSPDGRRIAFGSFATGNGDIYVMNADGTDPTQLTSDPAEDFGPAWSPDGREIAFTSRRGSATGASTVYIMNADGSDQHPVHPFGNQAVPAWQPLR